MDVIKVTKLIRPLEVALEATSHDLSVRQLCLLLQIAKAGNTGTEQSTLERLTGVSQAAISRSIKLFSVELKLTELFLDALDGRRRLIRLTDKGAALVRTMTKGL